MTFKDVKEFLKNRIEGIEGSLPDDYELYLRDANHLDEHTIDWDAKAGILEIMVGGQEQRRSHVSIKVKDAKLVVAMLGNRFFVANDEPLIHPTAILYPCVTLGRNVKIGPYAVIGAPGFGFVKGDDGNWIRFPQLGKVFIGDNVEIAANCTIDRGALSDTIIGNDVKINASVHIAHNVRIGEHTVITANVNISGSAKIGKSVWIGPGATLRDHIEIGDKAYIGMGSNVVKSIPALEVWCGNPARKVKEVSE